MAIHNHHKIFYCIEAENFREFERMRSKITKLEARLQFNWTSLDVFN